MIAASTMVRLGGAPTSDSVDACVSPTSTDGPGVHVYSVEPAPPVIPDSERD